VELSFRLTGLLLVAAGCTPPDTGDTQPDSRSETGDSGETGDSQETGDSGETTEPWCPEPATALQYVDMGEAWGVIDSTDGIPERKVSNPLAMLDVDGDGLDELVVATRNNGVWLHRLSESGFDLSQISTLGDVTSIAAGDVQGDGHLDLVLVGTGGGLSLLVNEGSGIFEDRTEAAGLALSDLPDKARHATFGDLDGDSDMDLFLTVASMAGNTDPATLDRVFFNEGGAFTDGSEHLDASLRQGLGWSTLIVDIDNDGDMDLYTANAEQQVYGPSRLLLNQGNDGDGAPVFLLAPESCGCQWNNNPMGASVADFDGDGLGEIFLTNTGSNTLLWNLGGAQFADVTAAWGATVLADSGAMTFGAVIYDHDNDGYQDLATSAGPLRGDSPIAWQPEEQPDVLLAGGPEGFTDISAVQGIDEIAAGRGVATGLLDDDGVLELAIAHVDGPTRLYRSDCTANRALVVDLQGQPPNTFGIGARVEVHTDDARLVRIVTANAGWGSTIHPRAHFGLGAQAAERLVVYWPSGSVQEVELSPQVEGRMIVSEP
jgi:hypothetical protein